MASGVWGDIKRLREGEGGSISGTKWMLDQLKQADCIVALNQQVSDELLEIDVKPERVIHLPNGVEIEHIKPKTDYSLEQKVTVTFVGRLHPQKGVAVLLSAFKKAREELPQFSWCLQLIGEGSQRFKFETLAQQMSIEKEVEFLGQVSDPFPLLGQSDIFVLPSRSEGMSNALLEALAHGLPCVVTDIAGNNDVIQHNENGLLVQLDDVNDLATALTSLATNQKLRERLGQQGLKIAQEKYSLDSVTNQYVTLYTNLLRRK
jgi:glycosyltransferase involved in cell wall biosynthesis